MYGANIQEDPGPRCAIRRIASTSFCFNCRLHWGSQEGKVLGATIEPRLEPAYAFTAAETARLMIYRAAIQAGFYSDQSAPRRRSASVTSDGCGASTVAARQRVSAANEVGDRCAAIRMARATATMMLRGNLIRATLRREEGVARLASVGWTQQKSLIQRHGVSRPQHGKFRFRVDTAGCRWIAACTVSRRSTGSSASRRCIAPASQQEAQINGKSGTEHGHRTAH